MNSRTELRKLIRTRRQELSIDAQAKASELILQQLSSHTKILSADKIALYLANDGELNLMPFIQWCWAKGKQVYLPVIHPFCTGHLLFLQYQQNTLMTKNSYGISEPKLNVNSICPLNQLDIICTPLVAFDDTGARLGMGGGFYDRTLAHWQNLQHLYPLGLAHDCQQIEQIPTQIWDIPLPEIITPYKSYKF